MLVDYKIPNKSWDYSLILKQPDMTLDLLKIIEEKLDFNILSVQTKTQMVKKISR